MTDTHTHTLDKYSSKFKVHYCTDPEGIADTNTCKNEKGHTKKTRKGMVTKQMVNSAVGNGHQRGYPSHHDRMYDSVHEYLTPCHVYPSSSTVYHVAHTKPRARAWRRPVVNSDFGTFMDTPYATTELSTLLTPCGIQKDGT